MYRAYSRTPPVAVLVSKWEMALLSRAFHCKKTEHLKAEKQGESLLRTGIEKAQRNPCAEDFSLCHTSSAALSTAS